ncbi:MAG: hypothetical protein Q8O19_00750 [Rectinemataceae bacterium]|nr:hypothetical protein [Rectinemataceae bacterium]
MDTLRQRVGCDQHDFSTRRFDRRAIIPNAKDNIAAFSGVIRLDPADEIKLVERLQSVIADNQ